MFNTFSPRANRPVFWLLCLILTVLIQTARPMVFYLVYSVFALPFDLLGFSPGELLTFPSLAPGQPFNNPIVTRVIGPQGGIVELPNVARLEIPAGALEHLTPIGMMQVLQVASTQHHYGVAYDTEQTIFPGSDFITPVVRLEPFGLKLNRAAKLFLHTDAARVGNNDPDLIEHCASLLALNESWTFEPYLEPLGTPKNPAQSDIQGPLKVRYLVYVAKQFPADIRPDEHARFLLHSEHE